MSFGTSNGVLGSTTFQLTGATTGAGFAVMDGTTQYVTVNHVTSNETEVRLTAQKSDDKIINPALYFRLIKSKLTTLEQDKLKRRLKALYQQVKKLEDCGQQAAFEIFAAQLSVVVRESEIVACGYPTFVHKETIDRFMKAGYMYKNLRNTVFFKKLEDFPRVVPDDVRAKIKDVKEKKLFDELWVLYLDYTKEEIKTTKQKIKEKDPILFGKLNCNDERYYYIADWIDEKCDLTMKSLIKELEAIADATMDHPSDMKMPKEVEEIDMAYVCRLNEYVKDQANRMSTTNSQNYKKFMEDEEKAKAELKVKIPPPVQMTPTLKPWWKLW